MNSLVENLVAALGTSAVATGSDVGEKYSADWSGASYCLPSVVVRPSSTEELAQVLKICQQASQKVVVQGGLTGLAGGATPQENELSISLERLSGIEEVDTESMTITALAGTPLQILQEAAEEAGFYLPLDMGSRGSCTIGGNVATNAGGTQVIRYGMTRALVLGLEVVLADGTVISSLNKMLKNNAGFDLKQLFIGSEGALGVVTKVVLRLFPKMTNTHTALCALPDFDSSVALLKHFSQTLNGAMSAFEVMWDSYYHQVINRVDHVRNPFSQPYPLYAVIEMQDGDGISGRDRFEAALCDAMEQGLVTDAVIAQSAKDAESFWQIRDGIADLLPLLGPVANLDISLPISVIKPFLDQLETELDQAFPELRLLVFGHIGDSNLHICAGTGQSSDKEAITALILRLVGEYRGSISAEHGIGILKKPYLGYSRTAEEIALMKTLKQALDPHHILNNGRVI